MTSLCCDVLNALQGKTLATAESCTGGMIGAALTAVPGSSAVYKGGVISYTNQIKEKLLQVDPALLNNDGAVSKSVAKAMAQGAKNALSASIAISVTGLAGPGGDEFGNPVGTVFIGFADEERCFAEQFCFEGSRQQVRQQAAESALRLLLRELK